MARMTIKNEDGTYSALSYGYEDSITEETRHYNDIIQKLGKYEDVCDDPDFLAGIFLAKLMRP